MGVWTYSSRVSPASGMWDHLPQQTTRTQQLDPLSLRPNDQLIGQRIIGQRIIDQRLSDLKHLDPLEGSTSNT